ncbi:MAG: hypothetical protein QM780_11245 [Hyphomicrobium sp.]|uniref:hypothetical protein n=1 Tax=Hyphomicrobium sp. TaxID=82 RepID=UPI0039E55237
MARGAVLAISMLAGAGTSFAYSGSADEQQACTSDVFRLCSAYIPNEDRIVACLNKHMAKLSPACRSVMKGEKPKSKSGDTR